MFTHRDIVQHHAQLTASVCDLRVLQNRERTYSEFRVIRRGGQPEVWRGYQRELPLEPEAK